MASEDERRAKLGIGCALAVWLLFAVTPIYLAIVYGIISQLPAAPTWLWVCFWVYVPVTVLNVVFKTFIEAITKD